MCFFSGPVQFVGKTKIFARLAPEGRQLLAYAMDVELDAELAMVLPLPVARGAGEDAVPFIDLEAYPNFFDDMGAAFPADFLAMGMQSQGFGARALETPKLVVHEVGKFEASFVPTRADFARLDARFRMADRVWDQLPAYADYGFAVFRLKPKKSLFGRRKAQSIHPMAFSFPSREPNAIFFPTVHVHDGTVSPRANFDHTLYCQAEGELAAALPWTHSSATLGAHVDASRAKGLVDGTRGGHSTALAGWMANEDTWLRTPAAAS